MSRGCDESKHPALHSGRTAGLCGGSLVRHRTRDRPARLNARGVGGPVEPLPRALEAARRTLARPDDAVVAPIDDLDPKSIEGQLASLPRIDHAVISAVVDENRGRRPFLEQDEEVLRASFDKF